MLMAMSDKKQTILDELKLHIAKSNTAIAQIIKNKYPELFDGVETETIRKRIGELRSDFDLYPTDEQMQSEEEQIQQKVIIKDTDIEIDKDVWLKKEYENTNLKSTISEKDKIIKVLRNELFEKSEKLDYVLDLKSYNPQKFKITANPEIKSESTAILCASDWHIEERIDLSTVNGLNEFNLEIAKESANNFFARGVRLIEVFGKDTDINDVVLWLGGDFISGYIHEELMESNYLTPIEATLVVMDMLSNGINYILKNTKCRLTVPTSVGNHGRSSEKRKISTENKNSYEYLMYHMLRRQFEGNDRVNFIIEDGYLTYVDVYDYKIRFHHGHALNYNGGVGGLTIPTAKAIAQWDKETKAYLDIFGHFHTLMMDTGTAKFVVNGSLVGYSPFALRIKAPYEAPKQAFVLIDKNRGKTISAPIFVR